MLALLGTVLPLLLLLLLRFLLLLLPGKELGSSGKKTVLALRGNDEG